MPISHKLRTLAAATAVSALALVGLPPAASQDLDESVSSKDAKSMLVMDLSGSMLESDIDGGTRLDAAKTAATELIDSMPDTANLGMMVYGQKVPASEPKEEGCKDIEVVAPVGKSDKQELKKSIAGFTASGYTPMGESLLAAAEELGDTGDRSIILVSDGIDTCAPPPVCEVAQKLGGQGFDLTIHSWF
ncbi:VWA domain-containing protein [Rothia nasisuis]|uniref:VWA domain-containing protein n=1 Tax=Rothia nasisuis TaxID=2109647 RepID=UPI001F3991A5|nr:VWA domain-containing protein [Rothia nasisuis]